MCIKKARLYVYVKANAMDDHCFTDDVALCYANSLDEAVEIFEIMYVDARGNVKEASFNAYGICVCTDY